MGTITYIDGNVLDADCPIIGHGVKSYGGFGFGVAGQIAKRFPEVKRAYLRKYEKDEWAPGEIQLVQTDTYNKLIVANLATQKTYGKKGCHVDYASCEQAFDRLGEFCSVQGYRCAIPKIGTGLGGGEWKPVEDALRKAVDKWDFDVEVYSLDES